MQLDDLIKVKFGSQAKCARAMNWTRQKLNLIVHKKREARVTDINELAHALDISVEDVVIFLTN